MSSTPLDTPAADMRLPVFIDVDTGVDDAMALAYLFGSPEAELVGIAATAGNVAVHKVCQNNLALLELCGIAGVPVSGGAQHPLSAPLRTAEDTHGPQGLGYAQLPAPTSELTSYDAAEAWIRAARDHPGELIGIATGPLTNLALAVRAEPSLPRLLRRLVIMGGSFDYRGNTTPVAEWNACVDPESTQEVYAAWRGADTLPIVLGLNLTESIAMTPALLNRLAQEAESESTVMSERDSRGTTSAASNPLIRVLEDAMRFYFEFHHDQGEGYLAHLHDPLAVAVALDTDLVTCRPASVDIELAGALTRGMTIADWNGHWGREPNALIGVDVDPAAFFDRFIARVGAFAKRLNHS